MPCKCWQKVVGLVRVVIKVLLIIKKKMEAINNLRLFPVLGPRTAELVQGHTLGPVSAVSSESEAPVQGL